MDFVKKEWKTIGFMICLIGIIVYLFGINSQLRDLQSQNTKIISTFGSIESVTISSDSSLGEIIKKVDKIENNVSYIVKKVRRRN
ncbi:MAG: hypothetical protein PVJ84_09890 [Desulfobacteraceae bacterium]|jgi:hypothetical protein